MVNEAQARRFLVMGNWKMHGDRVSSEVLVQRLCAKREAIQAAAIDVVVCPPATLIASVAVWGQSNVMVGGQDCHTQAQGAYTGDVSAEQLRDVGAQWVLVGHSERRQYHQESNALVREKALAAYRAGIKPVICVGETLEQREAGLTNSVVREQVLGSVPANDGMNYIAYEPVWAIGTGKVPTMEDIAAVHACIITTAKSELGIDEHRLIVLYGGSVKASNANAIRQVSGVGGMLVGGASLDADEFSAIMDAAISV